MTHFQLFVILWLLVFSCGCQTWRPLKITDKTPVTWRHSDELPQSLKEVKTVGNLRVAYRQGLIPSYFGESCVFWMNSLEGMQALLEEGAPVGQGRLEDVIAFHDVSKGFKGEPEEAYKLFIHYGLSPTGGSKMRLPPVFSRCYDAVEWALKNGADPNTSHRDFWGLRVPLTYLISQTRFPRMDNGDLAIARLLLRSGADVNKMADPDVRPPITIVSEQEFMVEKNRQQWINLFLRYGANKADIRPAYHYDWYTCISDEVK